MKVISTKTTEMIAPTTEGIYIVKMTLQMVNTYKETF
jgi:hypothetical protein